MKEDLLDTTEGIRIAKTRTSCECAYSGDEIPQGEHGLLFRMQDSRDGKDKTYSTWVSIKKRTELEHALSDFDFEDNEPREDISPSGSISYSKVKGKTISCLACEDSMEKGEEGVAFVNYTNRHRTRTAWCHVDCVPVVCGALGNVDDYAMDIVVQTI